ncbi:large ribosomal subunit protein cL37 alpha-like [Nicotiana tomentosiformis]|uniref:large ribosomal subunit protein cL37 alpha-like n=1 Tax=Nicotiana tomentosiformis TaxID=4098 RepID=UPI00388C977A
MGIVDSSGVSFMTFQFRGAAYQWWLAYELDSPTEAYSLTWTQFSDMFLREFCNDPIALQPKSYVNYYIKAQFILKQRSALIAKTATDIDSVGSDNTESDEESVLVGNLPLESKLQLKLEQKMKMKLAKNIRLRRKKLVRKRRLRKKG